MTVHEFITNQPDTEKVVVCTNYDSYRMTAADIKAADENKHYIIDSYYWTNDKNTWFFAENSSYPGMPDEINSEYLVLCIHDGRDNL